ncbi:hypothetical protein CSKR_107670, partial [Clonorchis sinensis]
TQPLVPRASVLDGFPDEEAFEKLRQEASGFGRGSSAYAKPSAPTSQNAPMGRPFPGKKSEPQNATISFSGWDHP